MDSWKTSSCINHANPWTTAVLTCSKPAFLAVAYLSLLPFNVWVCSLVLFLMPPVFLSSFLPCLYTLAQPGFSWPKEAGQDSLEGELNAAAVLD